MRIAMCDAKNCGEVFKPYSRIMIGDKTYEGNMLTLVTIDRDGKMHSKGRAELCPKCMEKLHTFLQNELEIDFAKREKADTMKGDDGEAGELAASADYDPPVQGGSIEGA